MWIIWCLGIDRAAHNPSPALSILEGATLKFFMSGGGLFKKKSDAINMFVEEDLIGLMRNCIDQSIPLCVIQLKSPIRFKKILDLAVEITSDEPAYKIRLKKSIVDSKMPRWVVQNDKQSVREGYRLLKIGDTDVSDMKADDMNKLLSIAPSRASGDLVVLTFIPVPHTHLPLQPYHFVTHDQTLRLLIKNPSEPRYCVLIRPHIRMWRVFGPQNTAYFEIHTPYYSYSSVWISANSDFDGNRLSYVRARCDNSQRFDLPVNRHDIMKDEEWFFSQNEEQLTRLLHRICRYEDISGYTGISRGDVLRLLEARVRDSDDVESIRDDKQRIYRLASIHRLWSFEYIPSRCNKEVAIDVACKMTKEISTPPPSSAARRFFPRKSRDRGAENAAQTELRQTLLDDDFSSYRIAD
jgi:hypothetical protein